MVRGKDFQGKNDKGGKKIMAKNTLIFTKVEVFSWQKEGVFQEKGGIREGKERLKVETFSG